MKSEVLAMITGKDQNVLSERVLALLVIKYLNYFSIG